LTYRRLRQRILSFIEETTFEQFQRDVLLQSAVERQSEIIGEALKQALDIDASIAGRITEARRIVAFRNRLIHGYADVSPQIVWGISRSDVPILLEEVSRIMDSYPSPPTSH
jgi:uncharacterized protein with HEPN domain